MQSAKILNHSAVHLKLTQYCKSAVLKLKTKKKKKKLKLQQKFPDKSKLGFRDCS